MFWGCKSVWAFLRIPNAFGTDTDALQFGTAIIDRRHSKNENCSRTRLEYR